MGDLMKNGEAEARTEVIDVTVIQAGVVDDHVQGLAVAEDVVHTRDLGRSHEAEDTSLVPRAILEAAPQREIIEDISPNLGLAVTLRTETEITTRKQKPATARVAVVAIARPATTRMTERVQATPRAEVQAPLGQRIRGRVAVVRRVPARLLDGA